ncbi:MAG: TolC family protein [Magnetococcales bacterium]|nr:TolC family protein [Magnetococcales bacterium]
MVRWLMIVAAIGWFVLPACAEEPTVSFRDLLQQAAAHNPAYQEALARWRAVREKENQTLGRLLPEANVNWSHRELEDRWKGGSNHNSIDTSKLEARQTIFDLARLREHQQSRPLVRAAEQDSILAKQTLHFQVAESSLQVLQARELLEIARKKSTISVQHLENTRTRQQSGELTRTDLSQADSRQANAEAERIEAEKNLHLAEQQFQELVTVPPPLRLDAPPALKLPPEVTHPPAGKDLDLESLVAQRPDIRAADLRLQEGSLKIGAASAEHWPTANVTAGWQKVRDKDLATKNYVYDDAYVLMEINLPLFNGGQTVSRERQARAEQEALAHNLEKMRRNAVKELQKAKENRSAADNTVKAYRRAVQQANEAMSGMEEEFRVGTRSSQDVLNAQNDYFTAQANLCRSRYQLLLTEYELARVIGLLDLPN